MQKIIQSAINIYNKIETFLSEITLSEKLAGMGLGGFFSWLGWINWSDVVHLFWVIVSAGVGGFVSTVTIHYTQQWLKKKKDETH